MALVAPAGAGHWHGVKVSEPDWGEHYHCIAFGAVLRRGGLALHLVLNGHWEPLRIELPPAAEGKPWRWRIDITLPTPQDIVEWTAALPASGNSYRAGPRSVVMPHAAAG